MMIDPARVRMIGLNEKTAVQATIRTIERINIIIFKMIKSDTR